MKRILFISGSLGLGHVTRDIAVARELRRLRGDVEIEWLAAHPATLVLEEKGEKLLPECVAYSDDNIPAEKSARGHSLNLIEYMIRARPAWEKNVRVFSEVMARYAFDLTVGDESYEISAGIRRRPEIKKTPYVIMYDFLGLKAMTWRPWEWLGVYLANRNWLAIDSDPAVADMILFSGTEEDIPEGRPGPFLPPLRDFARKRYRFTGYILPFDPRRLKDKRAVRKELGYGGERVVICAVGGTAIGGEVIGLAFRAWPLVRKKEPGARMVVVCGPRLDPSRFKAPEGVTVHGYLPELYRHYAASDIAIVQGGGTSLLELTALGRPFIYFPLEGDSEQEFSIAERTARHGAGIRMTLSGTTPGALAEAVIKNMGRDAAKVEEPFDGSKRAAGFIGSLL